MRLLNLSVHLLFLCYGVQLVCAVTSRFDRVWPLSGSDVVDFGQSSPFGPRLINSNVTRYDFIRGLNIPTPEGTPVHAIDNGEVRIAGTYPGYSSTLVQLRHANWNESLGETFYSNYMQLLNVTVSAGQNVSKGDIIGHTSHSSSGFQHLRLEIRAGGLFQRHCCNPWKFLPNRDNDYPVFTADVQHVQTVTSSDYQNCTATVTVAVPPDQLTFNRIELHIDNTPVRNYDMCEDNRDHSLAEMDNPLFEGNILISPKPFTSQSFSEGVWAKYEFEFRNLSYVSCVSGSIAAEVFDVFGTAYTQAIRVRSTRLDRIWPISRSDAVDLLQSSPFGPRLKASESFRYDFHRGVDIPTPNGTEVHAIDDGTVRIAGEHPSYKEPVVQLRHTGWDESPEVIFYSTYIHMLNVSVAEGQSVRIGDLIGFSGHSIGSGFEHLHFAIRAGGSDERYGCNPWKYLPNHNNNYSLFLADVNMSVHLNGSACEATVSVSVPPDQLTFNRVELYFDNDKIRDFDMCEDNLAHTFEQMDNPLLDGNIRISPKKFTSESYLNQDWASYEFQFLDLPLTSGSCEAFSVKVFDVFGNSHTQTVRPTTTRFDRVWPLSGDDIVDLGQATPYGPRVKSNMEYDFHHGVTIPAAKGTPIHAIDGGRVRIAGEHSAYTSKLVQIQHTHWSESPGTSYYSNYMNVKDVTVTENQRVNRGDIIAYTSNSSSGWEHLLFQIRAGGLNMSYCCNPWKFLPNHNNDYATFTANVELTSNCDDESCVAVVSVAVPPDQLTFNRIELHINDAVVRRYDMCADSRNHTYSQMDDPLFEGNILISASRFTSQSYAAQEWASYTFEFRDLTTSSASGGSVHFYAKAFDVFGNFVIANDINIQTPRAPNGKTRLDRVWPLSGSDKVDLGQASPFGPRVISSSNPRYDFHRGINIPTPEGTPIHAIASGKVRIAGMNPSYSSRLIQLVHTDWDESPDKKFYSHYVHVKNVTVIRDQQVSTGDIIGYSSHSNSGWEHLHFEIREGGLNMHYCCNPWKYLPNQNNDYSAFTADVQLTIYSNDQACTATVHVAVPPDQLTFNRIELHISDIDGQTIQIRNYDMCTANLEHSYADMDDPLFEGNIYISAERFTSRSYSKGQNAVYSFDFLYLPRDGRRVTARVFDVFENFVSTANAPYECYQVPF